MPFKPLRKAKRMNPSLRHASESPLSQSAAADLDAIYAKIAKRIIPFLACLFVMAWLDRYNVGFAKLQMVKDLGFSEAVYGFGAGIVYLGYMLFEVPSNLVGEDRRAKDLRAYHHSVGHYQHHDDSCEDPSLVLHFAFPPRLVRSRPSSGRGSLSDVLVSLFAPRSDCLLYTSPSPRD